MQIRVPFFAALRTAASSSATFRVQSNAMRAWVVRDFKGEMVLDNSVRIPEISHPNHVLLKVKAASVNPVDTIMCNGYGDTILSYLKQLQEFSFQKTSRLPFIGGRDCSGVVMHTGRNVRGLKEGDEVMAVIGGTYPGSHADYVLAMDSWCVKKPKNVSFVEAASLPYSACTAWAALVTVARLRPNQSGDVRVLIHGGAGGVGTVAIQMLKAWGVPVVVATCSPDSFGLVESLGAIPVDYNVESLAREELIEFGPYDVIMDCAESELAEWSDNILGIWRNSVHVSLINPILRDTDRYGIFPGLISAAAKYFQRSSQPALKGRWFSYAFFSPNSECLNELKKYVESGKMKPIIERVYAFEDLPKAYEKVFERNGRGKTVIDFDMVCESSGSAESSNFEKKEIGDPTLAEADRYTDIKIEYDKKIPPRTAPRGESEISQADAESDVQKSYKRGINFKPEGMKEVRIPTSAEKTILKTDPVVKNGKRSPDMPSPKDAAPV